MDSMTLIAVASIVTAGLTTGFGCHWAGAGGRAGGLDGVDFAGSAAGCLSHHHHERCSWDWR